MVLRSPLVSPLAGLPDSVSIYEVGPRDGLQNEDALVPTDVKIEFVRRLIEAGLRTVEVSSFVHPRWVPQLADAEAVVDGVAHHDGVRMPVLVPNTAGLARAIAHGVHDIAVFVSSTETFSHRNLNCSIDESIAKSADVVSAARESGLGVRAYVSMCFGDPWEGAVPPEQVVSVCQRMIEIGCTEICIGDTIGTGTPGAVRELIRQLKAAGIPVENLGVHFHDTYGQALANVLAALEEGVTVVDSSTGGLGGCPFAESATGNLATEDLVWMLDGLGIRSGVDLEQLVDVSVWMAEQLGRPSPSRAVTALAPREPAGQGAA